MNHLWATFGKSFGHKEKLETNDLDIEDILLLEDGHCFRDGIINLCKASKNGEVKNFSWKAVV